MDALTAWGDHVKTCERCRPHMGHVPFGLCDVGLAAFLAIDGDPTSELDMREDELRVHAIDRYIVQRQLDRAVHPQEFILHQFIEAYEELRRLAPRGDLLIHLVVKETL